jgi:hypothetical protein
VIRQLTTVTLLALAIVVGTWWLGWWTVPVMGAAWGVARYGRYPAWTAAVGAALAWVLLLGIAALRGPVGQMSRIVADVMALPGWAPLLAAVVFPAALAGTAARLARVILALME